MEGLLALLAFFAVLAVIVAPIGVMVLFTRLRRLTERLDALERSVAQGGAPAENPWQAAPKTSAPVAAPAVRKAADPRISTPEPARIAPDTQSEAPAQSRDPDKPPRAFVFRQSNLSGAAEWLKENWFLGIAAISLALAGIFMVQYGVEQGLLTPFARIMGALGLGAALIIGGEAVRRKWGDQDGTTRALPSTFSGAGIVTLFAAVLAARHMYDMLPADLALYALIAVAGLAMVLGWFYGPFLAAVGVVGAFAAPFIVGGSSDAPHLFFYYFALITVMALAIDTVRRWAWVSVLALIGGFAASYLLLIGGAEAPHALAFALIATVAATAIPQRRLWPDHAGAMLSEPLWSNKDARQWPEFPTRLAGGTFIAALALSLLTPFNVSGTLEEWAAVWSIAALGALALIWMAKAPALEDLSALAPLALLALLVMLPFGRETIFQTFAQRPELEAEAPLPYAYAASIFAALFALYAALGFWRARQGVRGSIIWIGASALMLPAALGALEIFWHPSSIIGAYPWAGHAIAAAALMVVLAERSARRWPGDLRPAALFAMSALSLISFALMLILSDAALSIAIAVMILIAALIDRRLDMPWLGYFIQLGVAVLGWRMIVDPGVPWASWWNTPLWEVVLGYAGPLALMFAAWYVLRPLKRDGAQLALESALWSLGAIFVLILLERALRSDIDSFWGLSLAGSVVLTSMGAQLYRWRKGRRLGWLRIGLAALFGVIAAGVLFIAQVGMSPLTRWGARDIEGPLLLDTIAIGYLVPAAILAVLAWKLDHLPNLMRKACAVLSALMVAAYVGFEIRRFWQGEAIATSYVSQPELYSYTIAMMLASVGLLVFAFSRRSDLLRKLAMAGIAVTIAKVFLIDMSGLTGLIRVASFLGLGLALTGLAWLNRAMSARWDGPVATPLDEAE